MNITYNGSDYVFDRRQHQLRLRSLERLRLGGDTGSERPGVRGHQPDPDLRQPQRARQHLHVQLLGIAFNAADRAFDFAPNDGAFNYSLDANGPQIVSVDVQTTPAAGPRAGKRFVIVPTGLKLPPDGRTIAPADRAESYSCIAKLGAKKLATGTGVCRMAIPKKKAKGSG